MRRAAASLWAASVIMVSGAPPALAAGNAATGAVLFNRCYICHSNTKDASSRMGPNLFGVVGRKAGTYPGFSYSAAMKKAGFVWTVARIDAYLADPQQLVPGNAMPMAGIQSPQQRADLAAYLAALK